MVLGNTLFLLEIHENAGQGETDMMFSLLVFSPPVTIPTMAEGEVGVEAGMVMCPRQETPGTIGGQVVVVVAATGAF